MSVLACVPGCAFFVELYRARVQAKQRREYSSSNVYSQPANFYAKITLYELPSHPYPLPFYFDYRENLGMTKREGEEERRLDGQREEGIYLY